MNLLSCHVRRNGVAYLALFVALGGTSYAAVNLPSGSVGTPQLKNGAVTPAKLNARVIGGSVRDWATVSRSGRILGGSTGAKAVLLHNPLFMEISWGDRFSHNCALLAGATSVAQGVVATAGGTSHGVSSIDVFPQGPDTAFDASFPVAVIC
jgi:hypothetical protein